MAKVISSSPQRGTFQKESALKRISEGSSAHELLGMFKTLAEQQQEKEQDPEWQKDNMEYDLRTTDWILEKVRASEKYAQNLYAAMCNCEFQKNDVWPVLKNQIWHCSWRSAGGIIANMRQQGDYIDWYCSGIREADSPDKGYVGEGTVTDEIREDLFKLGWIVIEDSQDET